MKILIFTSLYPNNVWPEHGVFVKERMTEFTRRKGCEARVVAPVPWYPPLEIGRRKLYSRVAREEVIEGVQVSHPRYLMIPKVGMALHGMMMALSVLPKVRRIEREYKFDLIDGHYVYPDGFAAVQLGRILRKPVVVSARGTDINLFPRFPLIRRLIRSTLLQADQVIAVSGSLKKAVVDLGIPDEKIVVIPNGVDTNKFYPESKEEARKKLGLPEGKVALLVGDLTPRKGSMLLLQALKILLESSGERSIHLVIVGEGSLRGEIKKMIAELGVSQHVRLAGARPHSELRYWYSAADVSCLPSSREGWPNVILESMACGTPVVATPVWGIPEIVSSEKLGLLVERNPEGIAAGLQKAFQRPWSREELVAHARQRTWDRTAGSVSQVFGSVLERRGLS